ncbi:MAG: leucine-rich repeat domain-containing protein, partial [Candidatus Paceibacterota bacterium]
MEITDEPPIDTEHVDNDDDEVLALLWEEWKVSLQSCGWTSVAQWAASTSVSRDPLHPRRITRLHLCDCLLTGPVPPSIGQLSSLLELWLNDNQLTSLPPEIGQLSSLQRLDLDHNQLTSLPREIGHLSSLVWLDLGDNQLTSLPPEMGQLSSLQRLYLADNCLIRIPSLPSTAEIRGGNQEDHRLPTTLEATTWERKIVVDNSDDINTESSPSGFSLNFYGDASSSSSIAIVDRHSLARRWPFFRHLLSAGLSEAHEGSADLSPYFSTRLGQCLVDTFEERPVRVSLLQTQDCLDLVEHADYFGL